MANACTLLLHTVSSLQLIGAVFKGANAMPLEEVSAQCGGCGAWVVFLAVSQSGSTYLFCLLSRTEVAANDCWSTEVCIVPTISTNVLGRSVALHMFLGCEQ